MDQKPSVGRIVHYKAVGSEENQFSVVQCRAAIITGHDEQRVVVALCVFDPERMYFCQNVPQDQPVQDPQGHVDTKGGTWHWPERV